MLAPRSPPSERAVPLANRDRAPQQGFGPGVLSLLEQQQTQGVESRRRLRVVSAERLLADRQHLLVLRLGLRGPAQRLVAARLLEEDAGDDRVVRSIGLREIVNRALEERLGLVVAAFRGGDGRQVRVHRSQLPQVGALLALEKLDRPQIERLRLVGASLLHGAVCEAAEGVGERSGLQRVGLLEQGDRALVELGGLAVEGELEVHRRQADERSRENGVVRPRRRLLGREHLLVAPDCGAVVSLGREGRGLVVARAERVAVARTEVPLEDRDRLVVERDGLAVAPLGLAQEGQVGERLGQADLVDRGRLLPDGQRARVDRFRFVELDSSPAFSVPRMARESATWTWSGPYARSFASTARVAAASAASKSSRTRSTSARL